jgi:hypothetical protein
MQLAGLLRYAIAYTTYFVQSDKVSKFRTTDYLAFTALKILPQCNYAYVYCNAYRGQNLFAIHSGSAFLERVFSCLFR